MEMNPNDPDEYSFEDLYGELTSRSNREKYGVWIETAARNGLVNGFPPDYPDKRPEFRMTEGLPREQAAAILARAAGLAVSDDTGAVDDALAKAFVDANDISPWARPYVLAAYRAKYIEGVPETGADGKTTYKFEPERELTRAEAAKLVYFVAKKNGKL
ncbi:MAG: S-layer homology domain-containing protein [Firmicutes bacterium]|nr:S-layer homology domain-containing protein [Bacillota bacterium]